MKRANWLSNILKFLQIRSILEVLRGCLLLGALSACGLPLDPPPRPTEATQISEKTGELRPKQLDCRPAVTGELTITEVLARPGDLDIDGDGAANQRDEAIEVRLNSSATAHLLGATLWLDGKKRGVVQDDRCLPAGTLLVLTGSTTADLQLPEGAIQLRLSGQLGLVDAGAELAITGVLGTVLGQAHYPQGELGRSLSRTDDMDTLAPFALQPVLPDGSRHSLGLCRDGSEPGMCWPALDAYGDGRTVDNSAWRLKNLNAMCRKLAATTGPRYLGGITAAHAAIETPCRFALPHCKT